MDLEAGTGVFPALEDSPDREKSVLQALKRALEERIGAGRGKSQLKGREEIESVLHMEERVSSLLARCCVPEIWLDLRATYQKLASLAELEPETKQYSAGLCRGKLTDERKLAEFAAELLRDVGKEARIEASFQAFLDCVPESVQLQPAVRLVPCCV